MEFCKIWLYLVLRLSKLVVLYRFNVLVLTSAYALDIKPICNKFTSEDKHKFSCLLTNIDSTFLPKIVRWVLFEGYGT